MDFFSSFFVVAATASAADDSASTDDSSDGEAHSGDATTPPRDPKSLADGRRLLAGPPRDAAAFLISAITSPFLVCAVGAGSLAATLAESWTDVLVWGAMAAVFAGVMPFLIVLAFFKRGKITDLHVAVKEQRWIPLGASLVSSAIGLIALKLAGAPVALLALTSAYLVAAVAFGIVSFFWKASIHAGVYCGAIAACAMVINPWWWVGILGLPAIIWARSRRGRHTVAQGIVGAAMATAVTCGIYYAVMAIWGG